MDQITVAKGISEFGMLAVAAGFFLVFSGAFLGVYSKFSFRLLRDIIERQERNLEELLTVSRQQNMLLSDISEGLRDETLSQIKVISNSLFDLYKYKTYRMVRRLYEENNIADKTATSEKIRRLLQVQHDSRNGVLDNFKYRGRRLSYYVEAEWIERIASLIENEISEGQSDVSARTYTNLNACFEKIKIDFYRNLMRK